MKKIILISVALFAVIGCYDDSKIWDSINEHEARIKALELWCGDMNANISSLQSIVDALQNNDYVTSVRDIVEDGKVKGYTITFSKSGSVVIYHGKDGSDGKDGQDGTDGKDGYTPMIGTSKDSDGIYYWTLDGEWLLDDNGNKIPTTGEDGKDGKDGKDGEDGEDGKDGVDGITPKLKIEDSYWYISYDGGVSWHKLEKAVGEDGKDGQNGDSFFKNVDQDEDNVYLTLADGSVLTLPLSSSSLFDRLQSVTYVPGYEGGKAAFVKTYDDTKGYAQLDFIVKPSDAVADLDSCWNDLLRFRCVETSTKSVNFIDLEIESYESDKEEGSFTIKVSGKNLSDEFFKGRQSYSAALFMTDGDNDVTSSFFDLIAVEADERPNMGLSVPFLSWGEDMGKVKDYMSDFELNYSDKMTLVYNGIKSEHLISYEFEDDKLVAAAMFVKEDMSDIDEILTLLEGYDVLHEYDGTYGEYASSESNAYAQVCKSEKSGETYWFIGWSEYAVDMGNNTITYLSSDNKAISISTLYGFGADLVANKYDKATNIGTLVFSAPVISIPDMAFSGVSKLKSMNLPESVKHIGKNAFANTGLSSIKIPENVERIDNDAFVGCSSLSRVQIDDIASWCRIVFGNSNANPLSYAGELYIDDVLMTELVIPDGLTSIQDFAFYGAQSIRSITVDDDVNTIGQSAFYQCSNLTKVCISDLSSWCKISFENASSNPLYYAKNLYLNDVAVSELTIPEDVSEIHDYAFNNCTTLSKLTINDSIERIGKSAFARCVKLAEIYSWGINPPEIGDAAFQNILSTSVIYVPHVSISDYKAEWNAYSSKISGMPIEPIECVSLSITADDVSGSMTSTTIYYEAVVNGYVNDRYVTDYTIMGTVMSEEFPENPSLTEERQVTLHYVYMGLTASTTITQGYFKKYDIDLNGQWRLSTSVTNPDSANYNGVYESFSNTWVHSSAAYMYIDIVGYETFRFYIRSYGESNYDYVMVSELDQAINKDTSYSNKTLVKTTTRSKSTSGTSLNSYTLVEFTNIDKGKHRITVLYRKDGEISGGYDQGYILIPKD